jgi:hypothetical protein
LVKPKFFLSEVSPFILNVYWVFEAVIDVLFIVVLGDILVPPNLKCVLIIGVLFLKAGKKLSAVLGSF